MAERMRVEGGKVTVEAGAPVTSVDFAGGDLVLEIGVTLRNCTIDAQTVVSTVPAGSADDVPAAPVPEDDATFSMPPLPPKPPLVDVEL